jgi:LacI family transcriptional regulator
MVPGEDRLAGYRKALNDRGRTYNEDLVAEGDFTEAGGYVAMKRLLPVRPDAVFAASDQLALGAWRVIREAGLQVPHDITLIGFDDLLPAGEERPQLTTIRQPVVRMGREAVNVLLDVIENGPTPQRRVIFDTELVIRESCGANLATR